MGQRVRSFEQALEQRGYTVLISVGFGQRPDGSWSIKLAASPVIRQLTPTLWAGVRETIIGAMDKLINTPLDDLETE